ncbi:unnamed protein product [Gongylonema pulchrum]|uniref:TYR_PHOSPHATASE_2 domain-containing protein n=1 Tax=Gongylonema pulchrum TaxID=637853 RepID=A0A183DNL7_9BILA|nr:unnamed protein product [Gongylonema pulchrum]
MISGNGFSVGLIIDLTDTDRYYDRKDIEGLCVQYEKINCPGRGSMIGVHCTDGVNRSGYLICRYLIDRLGWSSHDAIDAFERARGYTIERGSYVQALHRAAKERRTKKRHKLNEEVASSDESEIQKMLRKRNKHKKRRRNDENGTPDMEAVLNQMARAFEVLQPQLLANNFQQSQQHQSSLNLLSESQPNYGMEVSIGPVDMQQQQQQQQQQHSQGASSYLSAENSPFVGSTGTGEDDELSAEQEMQTPSTGDEPDIEVSKSKKRRERRLRLQKQFAVMKTGNFWKINEMQKEKFGTS